VLAAFTKLPHIHRVVHAATQLPLVTGKQTIYLKYATEICLHDYIQMQRFNSTKEQRTLDSSSSSPATAFVTSGSYEIEAFRAATTTQHHEGISGSGKLN